MSERSAVPDVDRFDWKILAPGAVGVHYRDEPWLVVGDGREVRLSDTDLLALVDVLHSPPALRAFVDRKLAELSAS